MSANPFTLEALEVLDAIERRGSFEKAAEELNKAKSALSYAVQKLEDQLGISIYIRQGRRSVLTPAGKLVLEDGRTILAATQHLADKAKEVATGWEPRLRIGVESIINYEVFFDALMPFQNDHPNLEIDLCETVLNGSWESLEQNRIDLVVGAPGPVPSQKGFRAVPIGKSDLVPVIGSCHSDIGKVRGLALSELNLTIFRRIVSHDTSRVNVVRSEGLSVDNARTFYVQTIEQKTMAILAGLGIGHLPRHRIQSYLDDGRLIELGTAYSNPESFIAWPISNKGKALRALSKRLTSARW